MRFLHAFFPRACILVVALCSLASAQTSPKREFRGAWVATVANLDWPSSTSLTPDAQRAQLVSILDQLGAAGINVIVFQVRPECDALYQSSIEPWSYYLTGAQGAPPVPFYDPLQFAIDEAHKRGMELHAWFNPYRAVRAVGSYALAPNHVSVQHPDWILSFAAVPSQGVSALKILDPGLPQVREFVARVVADIVRRYDVDGVHADDYFYPYSPQSITNQDAATFAAYSRGFTDIGDWRRDNVNLLMKMLTDSINAIKPWVKLGMSPFGIWKSGVPPGIVGTSGYSELYGDAIAWLDQGTIDYLAPQLYWPFGGGQDYAKLMPWWADSTAAHNRHLYIGQAAYRIGASGWPATQMPSQIRANRANGKVQGSIFFRANNGINDNLLGFTDSLKTNFYRYPSLLPVMSWKDTVPPYPPRGIRYAPLASTGRSAIQWDLPLPGPGDTAYRYAVYRFDHNPISAADLADPKNILSIVGSRQFTPPTPLSAGPFYYLVTALDRNYNESDSSNVLSVPAPASPLLAYPANGATALPESVTVAWTPSPNSASFHLQVSSDSLFSSAILTDDSTIVDTFKVLHGLAGLSTYYWRVSAANAGGRGPYSVRSSFATGFPLAATLVYPPNSTPDLPLSLTLRWNKAASATAYRIQVSRAADFSTLFVDTSSVADTNLAVSGLQSFTIYSWRVKASNAAGSADWSAAFRFRTMEVLAVGEGQELPKEYALSQNFPNPFNPTTTIQYELPAQVHVTIKIFDVLGREIETLINEEQHAGRYQLVWDAGRESSGIYFLRMMAGSFVSTRKMMLVR